MCRELSQIRGTESVISGSTFLAHIEYGEESGTAMCAYDYSESLDGKTFYRGEFIEKLTLYVFCILLTVCMIDKEFHIIGFADLVYDRIDYGIEGFFTSSYLRGYYKCAFVRYI
jgi:hypothetical protein